MRARPPDNDDHPSKEWRDLHTRDQLLRRYGYRIHARPRQGEPTWERRGHIYLQSVALNHCKVVATP